MIENINKKLEANDRNATASNNKIPLILLADDSTNDCKTVEMALKRLSLRCVLKTVADGDQLLRSLNGQCLPLEKGELPDLILLDLNMPIKNGYEALKEIKSDGQFRIIPVVVWSTSDNWADIMKCYELGANSFFVKPDSFEQIVTTLRIVIDYWFGGSKRPSQNPNRI